MGDVVVLSKFRSSRQQLVVLPPSPQEIISAAADYSTVEWMHRISGMLMKRIADTNRGMDSPVRAVVNEAVAVLRGQPRADP